MKLYPGAYSLGGKLFFKLHNGATVSCEDIGEPFVSEIVEACDKSGLLSALESLLRLDDGDKVSLWGSAHLFAKARATVAKAKGE